MEPMSTPGKAATLAAHHSLVRFNTGGGHLAFRVLSQRFLPPVATVLPIFLLYRNFGLYDTRIGLVLAYTVFTLPLSAWLMYTYFRHVPRELEDAALVPRTKWRCTDVPSTIDGPREVTASALDSPYCAPWNPIRQ
jgi:ABC-type maltose transport system permease subunit